MKRARSGQPDPDGADPEPGEVPGGTPSPGVLPIGSRVLLLNATFEPLAVVTAKRAVVLMLTGKAECIEVTLDEAFHSENLTVPAPSVMRLSRYVRVPYRAAVPMTRAGVLRRDGRRCAYCGRRADTIDHVVPRSRGGGHTWENCVAAAPAAGHHVVDGVGPTAAVGAAAPVAPQHARAGHGDGGAVGHAHVAREAHHRRRGHGEVLGVERLVEGDLDALGLSGEHEDDRALGRDDGERFEGRVEQENPGTDREHAHARRAPRYRPWFGIATVGVGLVGSRSLHATTSLREIRP